MSSFESRQQVDIPFAVPFTHRLRFTTDCLGQDDQVLLSLLEPSGEGPARVQFWVDENLAQPGLCGNGEDLLERIAAFARRHPERITQAGNVQLVPGGEVIKNDIHVLERMLKVFNHHNLDRRSYVVVIGGGAVLDAVGFAAAIAHRGIRLVRLPTTTLGQADSGIGVKNGVNLFRKKNWLGAFAVPWGVVNDETLLSTLSDRDFLCGFSEAVKVSLLKDPAMFAELCRVAPRIQQRDMRVASPMIQASATWHLKHITQGGDPFEMLEARPLDFGHWSAHKLEPMTDFQLRHGEAVAIGLAIDTVYSSLCFGFPRRDASAVLRCLTSLGFELDHPLLTETDVLFQGLEEFRQHLGGRLTLTMLHDIGTPFEVHEVDRERMRRAIAHVRAFARAAGENLAVGH